MNLLPLRQVLGEPKRNLGWFKPSPLAFPEPSWLKGVSAKDDPLKNYFQGFESLWKKGRVRWGWILRAHENIYSEGDDDCPGTVLVSDNASDEDAVAALPHLADRVWKLADLVQPEPGWSQRELEWWEDIRNPNTYHSGFKLPDNWPENKGDYKAGTVVFHRGHLPAGVIRSRLLPFLFNPEDNMLQLVPFDRWPSGMAEWLAQNHGFTPDATLDLGSFDAALDFLAEDRVAQEAREAAYQRVFGPIVTVLHEVIPLPQHIDVYHFEWPEARGAHGYVTGGMSDARQPDGGDWARIELVFYAKQHLPHYSQMLRAFSRYPWQTGASLGEGDTLPLGGFATNVLGTDRFSALLLLPGVSKAETSLHQEQEFNSRNIRFLTFMPLTEAELDLKLNEGLDALLKLMRENRFDLAFHPDRPCLVRGGKPG